LHTPQKQHHGHQTRVAGLLTLGVIGEYLGRVFNETKRRPLYLVESFLPTDAA
jgi:hypothetical protein